MWHLRYKNEIKPAETCHLKGPLASDFGVAAKIFREEESPLVYD
jgi:hypothetical protein